MRHGLIVPAFLSLALAGPAHAKPHLQERSGTALFSGNYCGPGNNAPAAPIDALDAACARHDAYSPGSGPATKTCNLRLQRDAQAISQDPREPGDLRTLAGFVYAWEFEKGDREIRVRVEGQTVFNNTSLILKAALAGLGLAYLPEVHVEEGQLVRVLSDWCPPFAGYHLYYPSRRQPAPAFALLVEALRYRG
jgi:DNA-binding transcriptional LysR family regulator